MKNITAWEKNGNRKPFGAIGFFVSDRRSSNSHSGFLSQWLYCLQAILHEKLCNRGGNCTFGICTRIYHISIKLLLAGKRFISVGQTQVANSVSRFPDSFGSISEQSSLRVSEMLNISTSYFLNSPKGKHLPQYFFFFFHIYLSLVFHYPFTVPCFLWFRTS